MSAIEVDGAPRYERRIGERVELEPTAVAWVQDQPNRRLRRRLPPLERAGRIRNVSITGAAIDGPAELPWQPGSTAVIRTGNADNLVVIRHRSPLGNGMVRYGVQLTPSSNGLRRCIRDAVEPLLAPAPPGAANRGPRLSMQRPPSAPRRTPDALDELLAAATASTPEVVVDRRHHEVVIDLTDASLGLVPPTAPASTSTPPGAPTVPDPIPTLRAVPDGATGTALPTRTEESTTPGAGEADRQRMDADPLPDRGPTAEEASAPPTILDDIFGLMED